jgi:Uma2 family endonuclease
MTATADARVPAIPEGYRTAADWLRDLGDVPLERILWSPRPGTATEADLLRKVEVDKQLCELVNGTLVEKPMGFYESLVAAALIRIIGTFVEARKLGVISAGDGPMRLRIGVVRLPDVAFIARERFQGKLPLEPIPSIAPDLAVEVLSESNTRKEIDDKIREYFAAGTRLVWIIDPVDRSADVYLAPDQPQHIPPTGLLRGENVLPGFEHALAALFRAVDDVVEDSIEP